MTNLTTTFCPSASSDSPMRDDDHNLASIFLFGDGFFGTEPLFDNRDGPSNLKMVKFVSGRVCGSKLEFRFKFTIPNDTDKGAGMSRIRIR